VQALSAAEGVVEGPFVKILRLAEPVPSVVEGLAQDGSFLNMDFTTALNIGVFGMFFKLLVS
jgi:hypothetical protein